MQSRNPYAKIIKKPQFKIRVVKSKKGKGSYTRKDRTKRSFLFRGRENANLAVPNIPVPILYYAKTIA